MAAMQDRMKHKRASSNCDTWTTREHLCLASSVLKSGDQNWVSVSRSLRPFFEKESLRPADWFSQKSCAIQYAHLLENVDTPKRKKRESGETTSESVVRKLTQERITELSQILARQKEEYLRLKTDIKHLKSGTISDEKLEKMWHDIQQEEREMDQKTRTHVAWLKRQHQQKQQETGSPSVSTSSAINQSRKVTESTTEVQVQETGHATESVAVENDEEKKSNRGGRSPLLTSLLKSPSPTTQTIQSFPSTPTSVQAGTPTITSLLGSSPKTLNAQLAQNVSPQLQQMVSTAIASATNATPERPSVGAPTLSMLLEMPASTQRGPLPNLQTTTASASGSHASQQAIATVPATSETRNFQQAPAQSQAPQIQQVAVQNEAAAMATPATATAPTNMPVAENMVQIIDHIDVMQKGMMANVIDKDEINNIIDDIEELIKQDITASPGQTLDTSGSITTMPTTTTTAAAVAAPVVGGLASMPQEQAGEVPATKTAATSRPQPRDVDEAVSLSDSPQSEMAIEEIDSSTSNIAEIIGTVAIDPQEQPKIIVAEITETVTNASSGTKSETSTCDKKSTLTAKLVSEIEINDGGTSKNAPAEEKQPDVEAKSCVDATSNVKAEENDSKLSEEKKETVDETMEDEEEEEETTALPDDKESSGNVKEQKDSPEDTEGDQQDVPSAEIVSVSSEVTNDLPSAEDTEKSQDISLILEEDDESSQSTEGKKKAAAEEQIIENTAESTESSVSFKEEAVLAIKEKTIVETKEESSVKSQTKGSNEKTLESYTDKNSTKKEEVKDTKEDTKSSILQNVEIKEEKISNEPAGDKNAEDITRVAIEETKSIKSEPAEVATTDVKMSIKKTESMEIKSEEAKPKSETEPEASGSLFHGKSPLHGLSEEDKKESVEVKQEKEEKEDVKKNAAESEQIVKETESTGVGEEPGELDEEESSLSKLSSNRAMKTYSKKQNVAVDSEPENESAGEGADYRAWKKAVLLVYGRLAAHKFASVFLRPITEDHAPGYHTVVFRPMDLSTIKKNIENGTIRSTMHFQRDVMLMFQNAIMYNKRDTVIFKMAVSMQEECLQHMQILVQATGEGTFRRETRTAASSSSEANESNLKRKRSHITPSPHDIDSPRSKKRRKSEND